VRSETGGRTALPIFREVMLRVYGDPLVGPVPRFPREIEEGIDDYLARQVAQEAVPAERSPVGTGRPIALPPVVPRTPAPAPEAPELKR